MKMKKSTWDAFMRRGASLFLVIVLLITSVTLPQIDWQKGEATTVHGKIEASTPKFLWTAATSTGFITSKNITTEFGYNEEETLDYLKVTNTTGVGVNMKKPYADVTGATATITNSNIGVIKNEKGELTKTVGVTKGQLFNGADFQPHFFN